MLLKYQACNKSPPPKPHTYLRKHSQIHLNSIGTTFPLNTFPLYNDLHKILHHPYAALTPPQKETTKKFLTKLATFNITTLNQLQDPSITRILTLKEFQIKYHTKSRTIKKCSPSSLHYVPTLHLPHTTYHPLHNIDPHHHPQLYHNTQTSQHTQNHSHATTRLTHNTYHQLQIHTHKRGRGG